MKSFCIKTLLFCLPILLLGLTAEILLRKIPNDYSCKKKYLDSHADKLEVLFLGNSHFYYGINPKFIKKNCYNAAYVSQTLDFDFEILKKYENSFQKLKFIVIPIDYLSLYYSLSKSTESWRVKNYNLYYDINYNYSLVDNSELFSNKMTLNIDRFSFFYFDKSSSITCTNLGWGTANNSKNKQDLESTGKAAAERHLGKDQDIFIQNSKTLSNIIAFGKQKNIKIVLVSSPAYKTYMVNLNKNQLENTIQTAEKFDKLNQHVVYYNLMKDNSFVENDFFDADHLNEIGAEKLTKKIDSLLK